MEILLTIVGLGALAALALRYGYDSRDTYRSHEEQFAGFGLSWENVRPTAVVEVREARINGVRVRLAAGITWLATWLDPTVVVRAS